MGQRSQIYVRVNGKLIVANYYQWNFGERMISRARYGIEYIKETCSRYKYFFEDKNEWEKLKRYFDVNFDMKDVAISHDIIKEWMEEDPESNFSDVFRWQDNNDGKLLISVSSDDKTVKYAFLDRKGDNNNIMNARQYMNWDCKGWENSEYIDEEQKTLCEENIAAIDKMAQLMTKDEVEAFISR